MGPLHQCPPRPPPQMPVFNPPCIIKKLQDAAHSQDTQTHTSGPSSILGAVYSNVYLHLAANGFIKVLGSDSPPAASKG